MKKLFKRARMKVADLAVRSGAILRAQSGEGFVDSAVFPVQDSYDRMNTIEKIKYKFRKLMRNMMNSLNMVYGRTRIILADQSGQGALDQVVSILISIVLGALLLAGLYALFADTLLPAIQEKVMDIFDYAG